MAAEKGKMTPVVENRKARSFFEIIEKYEAGISLMGTEVKSIRAGRISLKEAHCRVDGREIWLVNCNVSPFVQASINNHEPTRKRKLLLHKREIIRITSRINEKGFTCIPLRIYFKGNRVKIEIALVRGKKKYDRREDLKKRDMKRDLEKDVKELSRG